MSYTEYLRRKEAAAPKVIDTTLRLDASSYTQRVKFAASRMINEANLKETEQVDVPGLVSTIAGNGSSGLVDGIGTAARFNNPQSMCIDPAGLNLYILETSQNNVRRMTISTRQVTTLAGSTYGFNDGIGTAAQFSGPIGICIDAAGLNLYISDTFNHRIRKMALSNNQVSTIAGTGTVGNADGAGLTVAQFTSPQGICIDPAGLNLYIADAGNNRIRKIVISTGEVSTFAGSSNGFLNGFGINAQIGGPSRIIIDYAGLNLYVFDNTLKIRKIVISTAEVTTLAGSTSGSIDGIGTAAKLDINASSMTIDRSNSFIYFGESNNEKLRRIEIATANVTTLAGSGSANVDGPFSSASFSSPQSIAIDTSGRIIYLAQNNLRYIRQIELPYTYFQTNIPLNKTKSGGRIPDASTFTQYTGGQAVGKEIQAGMPAPRLLLNSTSTGSLSGCRIVPEPVPYNPAVAGAYTANMVPRDASQFTRDTTACRQLRGEPHIQIELGPPLFVDNTIVGIKNYNLPQNNSKTYIASECTQCGNNAPGIGKTCSFCIGANHLHPIDQAHNTRWGPRPKKSAQPIIVNQSPSDFHKVGAAMRKIPYVEKHHANPQLGHIVYPKTPYRIPRGTAAQLKINDPQRYPGTM